MCFFVLFLGVVCSFDIAVSLALVREQHCIIALYKNYRMMMMMMIMMIMMMMTVLGDGLYFQLRVLTKIKISALHVHVPLLMQSVCAN